MQVKRSLLVELPAERIFDIVERAEEYPEFVPWCATATILERGDDVVDARIGIDYHGLKFAFRTRNPKQRPHWLEVRMVEGPFRRFDGLWRFTPLSPGACRIDFGLHCEISDFFVGRLAAPVFNRVTDRLVEAFVRRAERVHAEQPGATVHAPAPSAAVPAAPAAALTESPAAPLEPPAAPAAPIAAQAAPPAARLAPAAPADAPYIDRGTFMSPVDPTIYEALRGTRLAAELDAEQCAVLAGLLALRDLADGEVLVQEGVADNHLYVVVRGTLGVVKNAGTPERTLLSSLHDGDLAGELGFLDGTQRYASLVALGTVQVLSLEREKLETLIEANPTVLYRVMRSIVRTVHLVQRRLSMQASELSNYIFKQHGRY